MAFIARIFTKLAITQYIFVGICTDFFFKSDEQKIRANVIDVIK